MMNVQGIYRRRFTKDLPFRNAMWQLLCRRFFQRYIDPGAHVLEIGAGYCEFINNISAGRKTALDINPDVQSHAAQGIHVVLAPAGQMHGIATGSVDVVFASNFFEHLSHADIVGSFQEIFRVLRPGGRFMVLQPNIRFCGNDYWMFFDHITPIDDRAFVEGLEVSGFEILEVIDRFLPYTTQSRLPKSLFFISLYLDMRPLWRFFGQQSFILSRKPQ